MLRAWIRAYAVVLVVLCAVIPARASIPHDVGAPSLRVLHVSPRQTERVGKWLIRDPLGEAGGINLTAFCGNDPVNRIDPLGLFGSSCNAISGNDAHYQLIGDGYYVPGGFTQLENNSLLGGGLREGAEMLANPRVQGGIRVIFGTVEILGGSGYILGSGGMGAVFGGGLLLLDGSDQVVAGGYSLFTGEASQSLRESGVDWVVDKAGGRPIVGTTINFVVDIGAGACAVRGCAPFREYVSPCEAARYSGLETRGFRPPLGTRQIPRGIPEGWRIRPTRGEGGVRYYDPQNPHNSVRVMPGDPASPFQNSQAPYIRWQRNGQALDIEGNAVPKNTPDAHIPFEQFTFDPELFK